MNRHSTLVSYLHRLLWLLTGNFGKPGTQFVPTPLVELASMADADRDRRSPVAGARVVAGLVPCNVIAEEILSDHPARYRAMIVESANPAHSLADSQRFREALRTLDTVVVIDVAMTETARLADYVLPSSTQYEKAEATFFNFEFPQNYFHLRRPLLAPPEGPLPEAEIHCRLVEALGALSEADYAPLRAALAESRERFADLVLSEVVPDPRRMGLAPALLYRTLGPALPAGLAEGAVLWGLSLRCALTHPASLARAGFTGAPAAMADQLFSAMLEGSRGIVFAIDTWDEQLARLSGRTIELELPDLLQELGALSADEAPDPGFPFVLSAGERRSLTANTIFRDPAWRNKALEHALRVSPADAAKLGVASGDSVRLTTRRASVVVTVSVSEMMQPGHVSLPNGLGVDYPDAAGARQCSGVAPNELTALEDRDPFVGTPWHKHVPARVEALR
jgi:anaerobic selenocysteine-containing dehydrogenase